MSWIWIIRVANVLEYSVAANTVYRQLFPPVISKLLIVFDADVTIPIEPLHLAGVVRAWPTAGKDYAHSRSVKCLSYGEPNCEIVTRNVRAQATILLETALFPSSEATSDHSIVLGSMETDPRPTCEQPDASG